jgi:membrane-bound lytic murein transglycosylase D
MALLLSGCSLLPGTPPVDGAQDTTLSRSLVTPDGDGTGLALSWTGTGLYLPDPEHNTLEAAPPGPWLRLQLQHVGAEADAPSADDQPRDLWDRLRNGYTFPEIDHPRIDAELAWYLNHPDYLARTVERARPYLWLIVEALDRRDLPQEIALLPIVESAFQPFAYSHGRAAGLWQFIPSTGTHFGLKQNWWYDGRRDVLASTQAALDYLHHLNTMFDGDWLLALAAYNSGSGTVTRAIRNNNARGRPADYWSLDLPRETRAYVPKLLALSRIFADPGSFDLEIASIPDEPVVTRVHVGGQIDLARAAELADISLEELYRLNPAFNRWATDPDGPHELLIPVDKAADFSIRLAETADEQRVTWTRHLIREGETLGQIAQRYDTTVGVLRQVNGINGHMIRAGRSMIIPVAMKDLGSYSLSAEQRRKTVQNVQRGNNRIVHTVRSGDTLWDIARKHRVSVSQLASWNAMSPRDVLRPGQRLVIWRQQAETAAAAEYNDLLNGAHPLNNVTQRISYTVRRGDSLSRISQRFNVGIADLRNWNALSPDTYLQPGQRLTLYVDITRQNGNI